MNQKPVWLSGSRIALVLMLLFFAGCSPTTRVEATLQINRTFHRPLVFRVENEGTTMFLQTIIYDGMGGYKKGKIQSDRRRTLSAEEAAMVRAALSAVEALSTSDPIPDGGRDGSMWVYSGSGTFPMRLSIWSPDTEAYRRQTKPLVDLGLLLWRLGKIDEPEKNLY